MLATVALIDEGPASLDNNSILAKNYLTFLINKKFEGGGLLKDSFHNQKTLVPGKTI